MQVNDVRQQVRRFVDNDVEEIDIVNTRQVHEVFTQFKIMVNELETEMERRLKEAPAVVKAPEPVVKTNEKPAPSTIKTNVVGESDGSSFNVGKSNKIAAQPSAIVNARKKGRKRKDSVKESNLEASSGLTVGSGLTGRPTSDVSTKAPSTLIAVIENSNETAAGQTSTSPAQEKPATPPTKDVAFTLYKSEQGRDLNCLFQENKEMLNAKKREAKEISESINKTKNEIDATKTQLDAINKSKEGEEILTLDENQGEIYLDEEEFELITKMKSLKNSYRAEYEYLQSLRSDFAYCENMVKRSRQQLLSEFETWYAEAFGVRVAGGEKEKVDVAPTCAKPSPKDEGEKFENVQTEWLMKNPDSIPYYNALNATERRKLYYSHSLRGGKTAVLPSIGRKTAILTT